MKSLRRPFHVVPPVSRRDFLCRAGAGFGALACGYLLGLDGIARATNVAIDPLNRPIALYHDTKIRPNAFVIRWDGNSWQPLGTGEGSAAITNRPSWITITPAARLKSHAPPAAGASLTVSAM